MYHLNTSAQESFEDLTLAREAAQAITAEQHVEVQVIHSELDIVAFITTPVPVGEHFSPWERIENPKHPAPAYADFVPAYTRKRIQATCYRGLNKQGWRVHDGRTGNFRDVANTTESRHLMTAMRLGEML